MKLKAKSDIINELLCDIDAEFLVSSLLDEDFKETEIFVVFDGQFKRAWSRDISHSEIEHFESDDEALCIHLNRDGVYDALPEALFHDTQKEDSISGEEMAKESMKLKMEEKDARLFFKPFENEIFFQLARLAQNETEIYNSLFSDFLNGLIPDFWKINERIPSSYVSKLIKLLPFAYKITGNYLLSSQALEFIIDEKVKIEIEHEGLEESLFAEKQECGTLGEGILGNDFIMGNRVSGFIGKITIKIGPLLHTQLKDYFINGNLNLLLDCFIGYFIPMELDTEIKLVLEENQNNFVLNEKEEVAGSFLGFNSVI